MAYTTTAFDTVRAERTVFNNVYAREGPHILHDNIRHYLYRRGFSIYVLSKMAAEAGPNLLAPTIAGADRQVNMVELRSQIADVVSEVLRSEARAIITKVLLTQGTKLFRHSMREQLDDVVGAFLCVQAVEIVRSTVAEQADDIVKGLVDSLFPPTPGQCVHNEMVGTVSTAVRQNIMDRTRFNNLVPGTAGEVVIVAGARAALSTPSSSCYFDDLPLSSPHDRRRGRHDDRRRDSSRSKSSDRARTPS